MTSSFSPLSLSEVHRRRRDLRTQLVPFSSRPGPVVVPERDENETEVVG